MDRTLHPVALAAGLHRVDHVVVGRYSVEALPENRPWKSLKELPCLMDFLLPVSVDEDREGARRSNYEAKFLEPLNAASETLRAALAKEVSG